MDSDSVPTTSSESVRRSSRPPTIRVLNSKLPEFERQLEHLVNETFQDESEFDIELDDSDEDPDYIFESDHDSASEQSANSDIEEEVVFDSVCKNQVDLKRKADFNADINTGSEHMNVSQEEELNQEANYVDLMPVSLDSIHSINNWNNDEENAANEVDVGNLQNLPQNDEIPAPRVRGDKVYYYGRRTKQMIKTKKTAFKWRKEPRNQAVRTRQSNIITQLPGLKSKAKELGTNPNIDQIWELLFSNDILEEIVQWTNEKISKVRPKYNKMPSYVNDFDIIELKGFIGLLVYTAAFKSGHEHASSLFATDGTGREIIRCITTKERFLFLLQVLRFDNAQDRNERKKEMKEAAISNIFYKFIENCQACYTMGASVCIDEMLVPFRGRCNFKMYMPKKPAKYGLKIQCLADAKNNYLFNAYIYTGKGSDGKGLTAQDEKELLIPTQAVLKLIKPIENSNRNLTADNWYSSIQLVNELNSKGLTYLGTLKKNKNEIPQDFLPNKNKDVQSTMYGYTNNMTLISYVPKKAKAVILVSSMHHGPAIDEATGKPEIIAEYNRTKGGVDTIDMKSSNYSCSRRTQRWPMVIFYTMVNIASGVNSYVLYNAYADTPELSRLDFLKCLAKMLTEPLMRRRLEKGYLRTDMKLTLKRILKVEDAPQDQDNEVLQQKKTCTICPPRLKRKTRFMCKFCANPICLECSKKVCVQCIRQIQDKQ